MGLDARRLLENADLRRSKDGKARTREDFEARGEHWPTAVECEAEQVRFGADGIPRTRALFVAEGGVGWEKARRAPGRIDRWLKYGAAGDMDIITAAAAGYLRLLAEQDPPGEERLQRATGVVEGCRGGKGAARHHLHSAAAALGVVCGGDGADGAQAPRDSQRWLAEGMKEEQESNELIEGAMPLVDTIKSL
eukprot:Hpha_TRINITY_DN15916_c5_g10::TRINITY_DN15916_c5_g10_i1::g.72801::m.72801